MESSVADFTSLMHQSQQDRSSSLEPSKKNTHERLKNALQKHKKKMDVWSAVKSIETTEARR